MRVTALHHYPVKGLRGLAVDSLAFDAVGPLEDRRWMVVDAAGRFVSQRSHPQLATLAARGRDGGLEVLAADGGRLAVATPGDGPRRPVTVWRDTVPSLDAGDEAAAFFSRVLGAPARLVRLAPEAARALDPEYAPRPDARNGFSDAYPALLTSEASRVALERALAGPLPMDRFRPNVVVDGEAAWAEDGWGVVQVGALTFDAVKPCVRCAVITTDQATGARSPEPLTVLSRVHAAQGRGPVFGMNLVHRGPGVVRVGDAVQVLALAQRPAWRFADGLPG